MLRRTLVALSTAALLLGSAGAASAAHLTLTDPRGDTEEPGLDLVHVTLANRAHSIESTVRVARFVRGDLVISVDPRGKRTGLRLVTNRDRDGHLTSYVLAGDFTDASAGRREPHVRCAGYHVEWHPRTTTVTFHLPARCLHGGDYTDVRFAVLAEAPSGDTDYVPETASATPYVARG